VCCWQHQTIPAKVLIASFNDSLMPFPGILLWLRLRWRARTSLLPLPPPVRGQAARFVDIQHLDDDQHYADTGVDEFARQLADSGAGRFSSE
jgi:hypothetical protein